MKKILLTGLFLLALIPVALAANFYAARDGAVYQLGTLKPFKSSRYTVYCYTYSISRNNNEYYIIKDDKQPYSRTSLLGCDDWSASNIFDPLVQLNSDNNWSRLTSEELRNANIRFVKYSFGKLELNNKNNDFNLDDIGYIDLSRMRAASNNYGELDLYLKPKKDNSYSTKQIFIHAKTITHKKADKMF